MLAAVLASSLSHVHSVLANQTQNASAATLPTMQRADNIDPVPIPPPGAKDSSFGDAFGMQFKAIIGFFSVEFLLRIMGAFVVLLFALIIRWILCRLVRRGIRKWHEHEPDFDETLPDFLERCMWYTITAIGIVAALSALGVPTTTLVTVLGAFALAGSLAIQDIVGSMMAGVLLISRRPFRLHDYVNLMGGGEKAEGTVVALDIVQTVLLTREHRYIYVPNKAVLSGIIINHSRSNIVLKQVWAVGYKENVEKVKAILMDILKSNRQISNDPPPKVKLNELKSDWMELMTEASVHVDSEGIVRHWIIEEVRSGFDAAGIAMSDTSAMDVNIYNCGSGPATQAMLGGQGTGVSAGASVVEPERKISGGQ